MSLLRRETSCHRAWARKQGTWEGRAAAWSREDSSSLEEVDTDIFLASDAGIFQQRDDNASIFWLSGLLLERPYLWLATIGSEMSTRMMMLIHRECIAAGRWCVGAFRTATPHLVHRRRLPQHRIQFASIRHNDRIDLWMLLAPLAMQPSSPIVCFKTKLQEISQCQQEEPIVISPPIHSQRRLRPLLSRCSTSHV